MADQRSLHTEEAEMIVMFVVPAYAFSPLQTHPNRIKIIVENGVYLDSLEVQT